MQVVRDSFKFKLKLASRLEFLCKATAESLHRHACFSRRAHLQNELTTFTRLQAAQTKSFILHYTISFRKKLTLARNSYKSQSKVQYIRSTYHQRHMERFCFGPLAKLFPVPLFLSPRSGDPQIPCNFQIFLKCSKCVPVLASFLLLGSLRCEINNSHSGPQTIRIKIKTQKY